MKKYVFLVMTLICCVPTFSARYLVELGTGGVAATWSGVSGTVVDLTVEGKTLNEWFNGITFDRDDEIWIAAGNYVLNGTIDLHRTEDGGRKMYSVYGGFAGDEESPNDRDVTGKTWNFDNATVLDGGNLYQIINDGSSSLGADGYYAGTGNEYWILNGLTFTNGAKSGNGGAMNVIGGLKIQNCQFLGNTAIGNGGAIYCENARYITVEDCYFANNTGVRGATVYAVKECFILNSLFEFNTGTSDGGVLYLGDWGTEKAKIENCVFRANTTTDGWGIVSLRGHTGYTGTIVENCVFTNNAGIHQYHDNDATLYIQDKVTVVNTTIANNIGGIVFASGSPVDRKLINTLVYGNTNPIKNTGGALANDITNCAIDVSLSNIATWTGATVTDLVDLTSVSASAIFANPTTFVGLPTDGTEEAALESADWSLASGSPCVDAGTSGNAPAYDILGVERPQGGGVDIGAYEQAGDFHTVTFSGEGFTSFTQKVSDGAKTIKPTDPVREGYRLVGWFTDDVTFLNEWNFNADVVITDIELFAQWEVRNTRTVTFSGVGFTSFTQTVDLNGKAIRPADPLREGYFVVGWFKDNTTFLNEWNFSTDIVTTDIELFAKWGEYTGLYLVELGTAGAATWVGNPLTSGAVFIDLDVRGESLDEWFNNLTFDVGDEIWIAAGTYVLNGTMDLNRTESGGRKMYSVYGGFTGDESSPIERDFTGTAWNFDNATILDGGNQYQIINDDTSVLGAEGYYAGTGNEYWILNGLTFTNGKKSGNGGAMDVLGGLKIQNCQFLANSVTGKGGAIYCESARYVAIENCYFAHNTASQGATLYAARECFVSNSLFEFNSGTSDGGVLFFGDWGTETAKLANCTFRGNDTSNGWGAMALRGSTGHAGTVVENCVFTNNAGIHQYHDNDATLYIHDGVTVVNSTIANNTGGIVFANLYGSMPTGRKLINTLLYGNTNTLKTTGDALANAITNCAIDMSVSDIETSTEATVTDLVDLTTLPAFAVFANPSSFAGLPPNDYAWEKVEILEANWSLAGFSPCIDAGTATNAPGSDILGIARPQGSGYDIGAYEYVSDVLVWTGAASAVWENAANWKEGVVPGPADNVLIPLVSTYPVLAANTTIKNLTVDPGASIELSGNTLSVASITAKMLMDSEKWYSIGFPFDVATVYSENFHDILYPVGLIPAHFWLNDYDGNEFNRATSIEEWGGYIFKLPSSYTTNKTIGFISGAADLKEDELSFSPIYTLQANPTFAPYTVAVSELDANQYVYRLNGSGTEYLLIEDEATIAPFESVITVETMGMAKKVIHIIDDLNGIDICLNHEVVVSVHYYTLQGVKVVKPERNQIYIVKSIYESGKTQVAKQIMR